MSSQNVLIIDKCDKSNLKNVSHKSKETTKSAMENNIVICPKISTAKSSLSKTSSSKSSKKDPPIRRSSRLAVKTDDKPTRKSKIKSEKKSGKKEISKTSKRSHDVKNDSDIESAKNKPYHRRKHHKEHDKSPEVKDPSPDIDLKPVTESSIESQVSSSSSSSSNLDDGLQILDFPTRGQENNNTKCVKVKSRWWKSCELEAVKNLKPQEAKKSEFSYSKLDRKSLLNESVIDAVEYVVESTIIEVERWSTDQLPIVCSANKDMLPNIAMDTLPDTTKEMLASVKEISTDPIDDVPTHAAEDCSFTINNTPINESQIKFEYELKVEPDTIKDELPCIAAVQSPEIKYNSSDSFSDMPQNIADIPLPSDYPKYQHIDENLYRFSRKKSKSQKQVRRMVCDCTLTKEEQKRGMMGCKEECLNRLLMIECGQRCPLGDLCSNRNFQWKKCADVKIFKTSWKGWGLRATGDISVNEFVTEFVGEVVNHREYRQRAKQYAKDKNVHCYFMVLKTDEILDATEQGNYSRFINHSCDPNCETQKWTVNGELRVGVFTIKKVAVNEEFTLDYQFQRYGREAQKCFCGSRNCKGYIGLSKQITIDNYSVSKSGARKKKQTEEDDIMLEEEIEKLNSSKGLKNREHTLKFARLMVYAEESSERHQLLDILLKTDEQACLRLFLDYHGLPLLWSWMADVMTVDLKEKILQVLTKLPITNKTVLLDSKVMSIVEKWNREIEQPSTKSSEGAQINTVESSDSANNNVKTVDFSDSDSSNSNTGAENSLDCIPLTSDTGFLKIEVTSSDFLSPASSSENQSLASEGSESQPLLLTVSGNDFSKSESNSEELQQVVSTMCTDLLSRWKNLKEAFKIPRLEQQKQRKQDEREADRKVLKDPVEKTEMPKENHIQVLIAGKAQSFPDSNRAYEKTNPNDPASYKSFSSSTNSYNQKRPRPLFPKKVDDEPVLKKIKEGSDSSVRTPSPIITTSIDSLQGSSIPILPSPPFSNAAQINYHPPLTALSNIDQSMFRPPLGYPHQVAYSNPSGHPPTLMHPPQLLQQPIQTPPQNLGLSSVLPQAHPMLPAQPGYVMNSLGQYIPSQPANYPIAQFNAQTDPYYLQATPTYREEGMPGPSSIPIQQPLPIPISSLQVNATPIPEVEEKKPIRLPKMWRTATDSTGAVYYYHKKTKQTQWDPPEFVECEDNEEEDEEEEEEEEVDEEEDSKSEGSESEDTPTYDEPVIPKYYKKKSKKKKTTKAAADTSGSCTVKPSVVKKLKELFRTKMSANIVQFLSPYRKPDCRVGRITNNDDFKHLARKLTHYTLTKELKQCKNIEDLDCNETVVQKAKDFVRKYMSKYGHTYVRKEKGSPTSYTKREKSSPDS